MASQSTGDIPRYNVVLLGESGVGKSSLILQFSKGIFNPNGVATLGSDFFPRITEHAGRKIWIEFIDTSGQERFRAIVPSICRTADAFGLVYDVTNKSSLEKLTVWLQYINTHKKPSLNDPCIILIGNKADSSSSDRVVPYEDGIKYAQEKKMDFFETSAKTGDNIEQTLEHLTNEIAKLTKFSEPSDTVNLSETTNTAHTRQCCASRRHSAQETQLSVSMSGASLLSIDNLDVVRRKIRSLPDWFDVGLELGLHYSTLRGIKKEGGSISGLTREMLAAWLKKKDQVGARDGPTWQQLANALGVYENEDLQRSVQELVDS